MANFTRDWNEATVADTAQASTLGAVDRANQVDLSDRLKEMIYGFTAGENDGKPGIKELIFKQQAGAPGTPNADEITLYSIDDGSNAGLYAIQEDGYTKQLLKKVGSDINFVIEAADLPANVVTETHIELSNNAALTAKNQADDGTVNLILAGTNDLPTLPDSAEMASSAAPVEDEAIVNKKYVDDVARFGVWNDRDANGSGDTVSVDTEYTAVTDGFVVARQIATGAGKLSLDMQSPTGTSRQIAAKESAGVTTGDTISATIPVKNGDTWKVVTTASGSNDTTTVYWMPLGTD